MPVSVHLFLGRENTLKEEALEDLKKQTLSGGNADLNSAIFYSDQFDPHEFQNAVNTQPFLSPTRFVLVREADRLPQEARDLVLNYVKDPAKSTILVITSGAEMREASGDPFLSEVSKYAKVQNFVNLEGESLRHYIVDRAASYNKQIDRNAVELIIGKAGDDLGNIRMAIEKLASYAGERKTIEKKDVEALVGRSLEETVFDMTKAMIEGRMSHSLSILSDLLRDSVRPENIIGAIGAEIKRAMRFKGSSAQAKRWFNECFSCLSKADYDLKNRDLDKKVILEALVVRLSELSQLA